VAHGEKAVRLWQPATGTPLASLPTEQVDLYRVAVSPSAQWLAVLDFRGAVQLWNLAEVRQRLAEVGLDW
jgi:hypothetical protein